MTFQDFKANSLRLRFKNQKLSSKVLLMFLFTCLGSSGALAVPPGNMQPIYLPSIELKGEVINKYYGGADPQWGHEKFTSAEPLTELGKLERIAGIYQIRCGNPASPLKLFVLQSLNVDFTDPKNKKFVALGIDSFYEAFESTLQNGVVDKAKYVDFVALVQDFISYGYGQQDGQKKRVPNFQILYTQLWRHRNDYTHISMTYSGLPGSWTEILGGDNFLGMPSLQPYNFATIPMRSFGFNEDAYYAKTEKQEWNVKMDKSSMPVIFVKNSSGHNFYCESERKLTGNVSVKRPGSRSRLWEWMTTGDHSGNPYPDQ